jgi:DNA-binding NarL/FixJ family response regulator
MGDGEARAANGHTPIRVVLVDDHQMILDGLRSMLAPHADRIQLVLATTDTDEALRAIREDPPDVALVDVRMKHMFGLDLCAKIIEADPSVRVVMLTVHDDEQYLFQALRAGAQGYLTKQVTAEELIAHLVRVRDGEVVIEPSMAGQVAQSAARLHRGEFWPGAHLGLTQRESEVLELLVKGHSNRAIASRLVLGEETIKTHVRGVYRKLGVGERSQAVAFALREGLFL